jgi:hypothetical protein
MPNMPTFPIDTTKPLAIALARRARAYLEANNLKQEVQSNVERAIDVVFRNASPHVDPSNDALRANVREALLEMSYLEGLFSRRAWGLGPDDVAGGRG